MIAIGIDTGANTGLAIWDTESRTFLSVETVKIHKAMETVDTLAFNHKNDMLVRFEDARLRKWYGNHSAEDDRKLLQGAGSVKRDCTIWDDYLKDLGVTYEAVPPKNNRTKLDAGQFRRLTRWVGRTSYHSRDAAMLVFGMESNYIKICDEQGPSKK